VPCIVTNRDRGSELSELNDSLCRLEGDEYTKTKMHQLYFTLDITTVTDHDLDDCSDTSLSLFSLFIVLLVSPALWPRCGLSLALLCAFHRFSRYLLFPIPNMLQGNFISTPHILCCNPGSIYSPCALAIPSFLPFPHATSTVIYLGFPSACFIL
jgi:hypothetical protein